MKYALLIYGNESAYEALTDEQEKDLYARHADYGSALGEKILGGAELRPSPTATTIRQQPEGAPIITDGPFAEAADLDEAIEFARQVPTLPGDAVEVRPLGAM